MEENKLELSDLTADEARATSADWAARVDALRRRWETSRDREALLGALIFFRARLPEWLFKGLNQTFEELSRSPHATRFLAVRYAHDALEMTMDEAYEWASENVIGPVARGGPDTMMKSYQRMRSKVAKIDRIQPRPRRRRRRR